METPGKILSRYIDFLLPGYQAYLGMMMVDIYHNHPLLKAAIEILQERVQKTSFCASSANFHYIGMASLPVLFHV